MLEFKETEDHFVVTQITMMANHTSKMVVKYSKDLKYRQINDEPIQETTPEDKKWFRLYYRKHFPVDN